MKSKKEFDSTMLYPFFAEKEPGERFLSSVLSKKVVIEELVPLNLDPLMGRLSCGLGLLLNDGGKGIRMIIYIKDKGIEEKNSTALMTVGGLMAKNGFWTKRKKEFQTPYLFIMDYDGDGRNLVETERFTFSEEGEFNIVTIDVEGKGNDEIKSLVRALSEGDGSVDWIKESMDRILSEEGKEKYSSYWKYLEKRWKLNLAADMFMLDMEKEDVKEALDMDENLIREALNLILVRDQMLEAFGTLID